MMMSDWVACGGCGVGVFHKLAARYGGVCCACYVRFMRGELDLPDYVAKEVLEAAKKLEPDDYDE